MRKPALWCGICLLLGSNLASRANELDTHTSVQQLKAAMDAVARYAVALQEGNHSARYRMYSKRLTAAFSEDEYLSVRAGSTQSDVRFKDVRSVERLGEGKIVVKIGVNRGALRYLVVWEDDEWRIGNFGSYLPSWSRATLSYDESEMVRVAKQWVKAWCDGDVNAGARICCSRERTGLDAARVAEWWGSLRAEPERIIFTSVPGGEPSQLAEVGADSEVRVAAVSHWKKKRSRILPHFIRVSLCKVEGRWRVLVPVAG